MLTIAYGTATGAWLIRSQPRTQGSGRCRSKSGWRVSGSWSGVKVRLSADSAACDSTMTSSRRFSACQISTASMPADAIAATVLKPLPPDTVNVGELGR